MFWKNISIAVIIGLVPIESTLICKTFYTTAVTCQPGGEDAYILQRGLVSDNIKTITIILKTCRISKIESNALYNPNLKQLDLSDNKISELDVNVLAGNPKLTSLRLGDNYLTHLPMGIFDHSPRLLFLDFSNNFIKYFEVGIFHKLPRLLSLKFTGNGLSGKDLNPLLFQNNSRIETLHFSFNDMSQAPDQLLNALPLLMNLELSNCSLREVPKFVTNANLPILVSLQLRSNKISTLNDPKTFANLPNLDTLDMSANSIETLNTDVFKSLKKLKTLVLSFNRIGEIPENFFVNMPRLSSADLSYNFIETVNVSALRGSRLTEFNVNANIISFLESKFVETLKKSGSKLTMFYFDDNPFQCACLLEIINELKKYRVKYNTYKYDGEHDVCSVANEFTCIRDKLI